jgi:hypothetical protein
VASPSFGLEGAAASVDDDDRSVITSFRRSFGFDVYAKVFSSDCMCVFIIGKDDSCVDDLLG